MIRKNPVQSVDIGHSLRFKAYDDVTFVQTGTLGRAALLDTDHKNAADDGQLMASHKHAMHRHILSCHAQVTAPDPPVLDETPRDELRGIDRRRKADALSRKNDRGVHSDDFSA